MQKRNKRQLLAAMAAMALLVPVGGVSNAAPEQNPEIGKFDPETVLADADKRDELANGVKQYFYGVTGGNVYVDGNTKDLLGQVTPIITYMNSEEYENDQKRLDDLGYKESNTPEGLTKDER